MSEKTEFQIKPKQTPTSFQRRIGRVAARTDLHEIKQKQTQQESLAELSDKVSVLDMSKQGDGLDRLNDLLLANAELGKPPMIFTKSTEEARDPVDVAFGDMDFTGKSIIEVQQGAEFGIDDLKQIQTAFPEGVTLIASETDVLDIPFADYESLLRPTDAAVVTHADKVRAELRVA